MPMAMIPCSDVPASSVRQEEPGLSMLMTMSPCSDVPSQPDLGPEMPEEDGLADLLWSDLPDESDDVMMHLSGSELSDDNALEEPYKPSGGVTSALRGFHALMSELESFPIAWLLHVVEAKP